MRGLKIVDVPFHGDELEVDLDGFAKMAREHKLKLVVMGMSMTLFPLPVREMSQVISEWGGKFIYDGAPGRLDRRRTVPGSFEGGRGHPDRLRRQNVQRTPEWHDPVE